jgi:hypothetical protein
MSLLSLSRSYSIPQEPPESLFKLSKFDFKHGYEEQLRKKIPKSISLQDEEEKKFEKP